jgi:hypothetical protein
MSQRSDDSQCCHENTVRTPVDTEMGNIVIANTSGGDNVIANFRYV